MQQGDVKPFDGLLLSMIAPGVNGANATGKLPEVDPVAEPIGVKLIVPSYLSVYIGPPKKEMQFYLAYRTMEAPSTWCTVEATSVIVTTLGLLRT